MAQIKPGSTFTDGRTIASTNDLHSHSNKTALDNVSGTNTGDETATRIGALISSATAKTTPVDADMVGIMDSASSNVLKKLSWANIKSVLKSYFDTLYNNYTHPGTGTNPHGTTKADVGLGSVDDNKQMPIAGGTFTGVVKAQTNTSYTTAQMRSVILSTADASAASMGNGDIWIKYV